MSVLQWNVASIC